DVDVYRGRNKLFAVSTRGGKPRLLALTDSWPVWSPSSDRIATLKGNALVSIGLHGRVTVLDRNPNSGSGGWGFSPDGRWVVVTTDSGLTVIRVTGAGAHSLTQGADDGGPVWGTHWIAFTRAGGIWRIRPDGTDLQRVLRGPRHPGRYGIWGYFPVAWGRGDRTLLGQIATPHAWDVGIRIDVATGQFSHVHGYPFG